jgi:hypothetical protein
MCIKKNFSEKKFPRFAKSFPYLERNEKVIKSFYFVYIFKLCFNMERLNISDLIYDVVPFFYFLFH